MEIGKAIIDDFTIIFRDTVSRVEVRSSIDSLRGTLKGSYFFSYRIWSRATDVRVDSLHWNVDSLYGDLYTDSLKIVFNKVGLRAIPGLRLQGAGWIGFKDTCTLGGQISGASSAASTGMLVSYLRVPGIERSGSVEGSVTFARSIAHPMTTYKAHARDVVYKGSALREIDAQGRIADGYVTTKTALIGDPGDLDLAYEVHPHSGDRRSGFSADVTGREIDLEHVLAMIDASGFGLQGRAKASLHLEQDSGAAVPRVFDLAINGTSIRLDGSAGPGADLEGSVKLRTGLWQASFVSPGSSLEGSGTVGSQGALAGLFTFETAEVDQLSTAIVRDRLQGALSAEATIGGSLIPASRERPAGPVCGGRGSISIPSRGDSPSIGGSSGSILPQ